LSFIIDGARTMLIAGTRGSGKSSVLTAMMIEIMRKYRIITIEDTLEIPTLQFSDLGFNIQSLSVRSALSTSKDGMSADMGIRSTLRLGDSCLIVGEVRSTEAIALYEAMRVGALANVVAGTIHGDSAFGVYDRLVNDLGVPNTSFKATDLIIVANPVKSSDGLHRVRRITSITEVRKKWEKDPSLENGFGDLMKYDSMTDRLEITDELMNGDSDLLKAIGSNVKQWAGNWDAIWDNIMLRAKVKRLQVDLSIKYNCPEILEAFPIIEANDQYHKISERVNEDYGFLDSVKIYSEFEQWFRHYLAALIENLK
jgi:flagellar protein FlaI